MDTQMVLEIVGYIGSFFVLVSFLMTSMGKLRFVNLIGCVISAAYSLLIRAYPMAFLNTALACINICYLIRLVRAEKQSDKEDSL